MTIQNWSEDITIVELADEPRFTDDMTSLIEALGVKPCDVVLNFAAVGFINSSNIARLLKLRKNMIATDRRLILCSVNTQVWGVFLVTGLDKIFTFTNDISTALATLQMAGNEKNQP